MNLKSLASLSILLGLTGCGTPQPVDRWDPPKQCAFCEQWNKPHVPFQIHGDTYYVGTAGLSSVLVTSKRGHILIDGALPQSAPLIAANVERLGFALQDIKLIVSSHSHYDHVGGIAGLQRATGAKVAASPGAAEALAMGQPTTDDPQLGFGEVSNGFPPVTDVTLIEDGQTLSAGAVRVTAHFTPGHTAGGTTWSWRSCSDGECLDVVYADSISAVSAPAFRFSNNASKRVSVDTFNNSIDKVAQLPCDIFLAPHPFYFGLAKKVAEAQNGNAQAFVDPDGCGRYAFNAAQQLDKRLKTERQTAE